MDHLHTLISYYQKAVEHQKDHKCTGVPYDNGEMLAAIVAAIKPKRVLELGTGIGYSTACLAMGFETLSWGAKLIPESLNSLEKYRRDAGYDQHDGDKRIDTIDRDTTHRELAKEYWRKLGIEKKITVYSDLAEVILPGLSGPYDLIFFDGDAPSMKFLIQFERLLGAGGVLMTANLFLKDPKGGAYLRHIKNPKKWQTAIFSDTALSVKRE